MALKVNSSHVNWQGKDSLSRLMEEQPIIKGIVQKLGIEIVNRRIVGPTEETYVKVRRNYSMAFLVGENEKMEPFELNEATWNTAKLSMKVFLSAYGNILCKETTETKMGFKEIQLKIFNSPFTRSQFSKYSQTVSMQETVQESLAQAQLPTELLTSKPSRQLHVVDDFGRARSFCLGVLFAPDWNTAIFFKSKVFYREGCSGGGDWARYYWLGDVPIGVPFKFVKVDSDESLTWETHGAERILDEKDGNEMLRMEDISFETVAEKK